MSLGIHTIWQRWSVALCAVAIALLLKLLLDPVLAIGSPFLIFFAAIMFSAWYGGKTAGILATIIAALLSDYLFLSPTQTLFGGDLGQNLRLVLFVLEGVLIAILIASLQKDMIRRKSAEFALRQSEDRYRAFVAQSSEGIWRIELEQPLAIDRPEEEQIQHLYQFGYIAECNEVTAHMQGFSRVEDLVGQRVTNVFSAEPHSRAQVCQFIRSGYRLVDVESHQVDAQGQQRFYRNNWIGIVESGFLVRLWGNQRDITDSKRSQALLSIQNRVLAMVATGTLLSDVLYELTRSIEAQSSGAICTVLLLEPEGDRLMLASAPSLPSTFRHILASGIPVGEPAGSCSVAAAQQSLVIVNDIAHDPIWASTRETAMECGLQASWSIPVLASSGDVVGTFGLYYRSPRQPSQYDLELVRLSSKLAGIAIERQRAEAQLNELLQREQTARAELEMQRSHLHSLLMQAPALICIHRGADHVFEFANDLYHQLVGNRDLIGKPVREAFPDLAEQGFFERLDQVYATGEPAFGREVAAKFDHTGTGTLEEGFFNFVYQPMFGIDGAVEGVMTFAFEVTDHVLSRQQAEVLAKYLRNQQRALKESEERYRSLIEATSQIIWNTNASGEITTEQPGWSDFTGQEFQEYKGWGWLSAVHPQDQSHTASLWTGSVATRSPYEIEHRLRRQDGEYRYMNVRAVPILESDGNIREWIGVHTDITDRKRADADREQLLIREQAARAEAEAANRTKDEFLATLSHELRTPLNAMLGWTQLLRTRKFDEQTAANALETIDRNSRTLAQLIEDVLDVSRIITGKLHLDLRPVDLKVVVAAAISTVAPAATAKAISIDFFAAVDAVPLLGDTNRLQQIVWNLLSNAIKFTPNEGRVEIRLAVVMHQPSADETHHVTDSVSTTNNGCVHAPYAQLMVSDTGQGIDPEFLPYVFDRFRQADGSITRSYGGLGLGLAIVRHLVELHGGTVQATSAGANQGATFIVKLPIAASALPASELADAPIRPIESQTADGVGRSLDAVKVLVVDDEADARDLLKTALEQYGASVTTACSATEAIAALIQRCPDILISDIGMPDTDGYDLIQRVRALEAEAIRTVPAIALTAYARVEDQQRAIQAGFQRHVSKPVSPEEIVTLVSKLVERTT